MNSHMKEGRLMHQLSMTQKQTMTSALRVEYFSTAWMAFEVDGKTISVDFTQGFGKYVHQAYVVDCKINPNAVRTKKISFL